MRTRFAPTPSGYLHEGNAVNALLVSWLAGAEGAVVLRIDDADGARFRREYAQDVLDVLSWLDVRIDEGPRTVAELEDSASQRLRRERYLGAAHMLADIGGAYACDCSRTAAACPCRDRELPWQPGRNALRVAGAGPGPGAVVWRRDDVPAYHLTSVVDDHDLRITHVLRGEDLRESTEIQRALAARLGLHFPGDVRHHPLLLDEDGRKLSKSTRTAGPLARTDHGRQRIEASARRLAPLVDVTPP